ncbi:MAG: zinc-binding alcohol dehydrogenase family protein [Tepidisphaeraceae bacterium]|jgi:NADPH:quinone reductase-like Zn-dependent oxidoreductase
MRAVVIHQFGGPNLVNVEKVPTPTPKGNEVLVEVKAAAINPSDVKNVAGKMQGTTLPRIPGRDFAGVVVAGAGELVGREVWGTGGDIGFSRDGSHAEYVLLPAAAVAIRPAGLSMEAAGGAGLTFVTAWTALVTAADIASGETVVIIGAAGGVGSAAVQIAKSRGARVIGVVRSDRGMAEARQNGADEVIDSSAADIVATVGSLTGGGGANVVLDTSGVLLAECVEIAAMDGRIPVIAAPEDGKASFNLRGVYRKELRVLGVDSRRLNAVAGAKLLSLMTAGFESGQFRCKLGRSFPLGDARQAYEQAARGGDRVMLRPGL